MAERPRYFAIVASMRTGSNLLERSLAQFPDLACHGELFNPAFIGGEGRQDFLGIGRAERARDPFALIERMIAAAGDRVPGFRIFDGHDPRILARVAEDPDCARLLLTRAPLDSFVSLLIARETGQWLLGPKGERRTARVQFDPAAYEAFRDARAAFLAGFRRRMQAAGRTAFALDYAELKDPAVVNGAAAHAGSRHRLERIEERIRRQNPGPLAEKVSNPEALAPYLPAGAAEGGEAGAGAGARPGPGVRGFLAGAAVPLLLAPVAGVPDGGARAWLAAADRAAGAAGPLRSGLTRREIRAEIEAGRIRAAFAVTADPLARAAHLFATRILAAAEGEPGSLRAALAADQRLALPAPETAAGGAAALGAAGWDAAAHRAGLAAFLRFVKRCRSGRSGREPPPALLPQTAHLAAIAEVLPLRAVAPAGTFGPAAAFLAALAGLDPGRLPPAPPAPEPGPWPLGPMATAELRALARAAWPEDAALAAAEGAEGPR